MAGNLSDWAENAAVDWLLGGATPTRPTSRTMSLHTGAPGETGAANEVSGGGYARQTITFGASAAGIGLNSNAPTWTASGGNYGIVTHAAIWDNNGNCLWQGALTTPRTINDGDVFQMPIGQLSASLD